MADLNACAVQAATNVQKRWIANANSLLHWNDLWIQALATVLPSPNEAQRTVANWIPVGLDLNNSLPTDKTQDNQVTANAVAIYVYRTCRAAQYAETAGRISAGQATAIYNAFQTVWAT